MAELQATLDLLNQKIEGFENALLKAEQELTADMQINASNPDKDSGINILQGENVHFSQLDGGESTFRKGEGVIND